jgi:hypothetical protein
MPDEYKVNGELHHRLQEVLQRRQAQDCKGGHGVTYPDWWVINTAPDKEVQNAVVR